MSNPFEDENAQYLALVNDENQYSLWPVSIDVPQGWSTAHGPAGRQECLEHIGKNSIGMRPAGLVAAVREA
ncbi:MbtH family protein [Streptomyces sp. enrichment culture]|uniref:MbtH family protein n=1 Tax=Streptomyces sp. enrichment culture TaxID=1795815 RepID=UPI003F56DDCA